MLNILEFQIEPEKKNNYRLVVLDRGGSQPLAKSSFEYDLSFMTDFEIRQLAPSDKDPQGRLERLKAFGSKLHDKLFSPEIQKIWQEYKKKSDFLVLCVRIDPEASGLESLPWETLYDGEEFIAAGGKTGLSRLPLDVEIQDDLPPIPLPIRMLSLISSPLDLEETKRLAIEREQEILLQAVNSPSGQGKLTVDFEDEAKLSIIESSLESGYDILHYSGHGVRPEDGGGLLLEGPDGKMRPVSSTEFLQSLEKAEKGIRLAVISGCQTARTIDLEGFQDLARKLVHRGIPAVIAMQFSILDSSGLILAEKLYPLLAEGKSLEEAVCTARRELLRNDDAGIKGDAFAPVLFMSAANPLETKTAKSEQAGGIRADAETASSFGCFLHGQAPGIRDIRRASVRACDRGQALHRQVSGADTG